MESIARQLRQESAMLGAHQGDPESPASGTLYARRNRILQEIEQAQSEEFATALIESTAASRSGGVGLMPLIATRRSPSSLSRELERLEAEIATVQKRIETINKQLSGIERKTRG